MPFHSFCINKCCWIHSVYCGAAGQGQRAMHAGNLSSAEKAQAAPATAMPSVWFGSFFLDAVCSLSLALGHCICSTEVLSLSCSCMGGVDFRAEQHFLLATLGRTQLGLCVAKRVRMGRWGRAFICSCCQKDEIWPYLKDHTQCSVQWALHAKR